MCTILNQDLHKGLEQLRNTLITFISNMDGQHNIWPRSDKSITCINLFLGHLKEAHQATLTVETPHDCKSNNHYLFMLH